MLCNNVTFNKIANSFQYSSFNFHDHSKVYIFFNEIKKFLDLNLDLALIKKPGDIEV